MIGTSGPSISTTTLSTWSPRSAASRCSAVEQSGPEAVAQHGGKFGGGDSAHVGADFALDRTVGGHAPENDAFVVAGRIQGERDGKSGMDANAGDGNLVA